MNIENLRGHVPDSLILELPLLANFMIDTVEEVAHLLGQCYVESGGFKLVEENLYYTSAERLPNIFVTAFSAEKDKLEKAKTLVRNPQALGDYVYASIGGYKFRGRGYIQLTGKQNYQALQRAIPNDDIMANPDLVATKYPLMSAAYYFGKYSVGKVEGVTTQSVRNVTATINRGLLELDKRVAATKMFYELLK